MQLPLMYHLVFLVLNTYTSVLLTSGASKSTSQNKQPSPSKVTHNWRSHTMQEEKSRVALTEDTSKTDAVYTESVLKNNYQNVLQFTNMMLRGSACRIKRSVPYTSKFYTRLLPSQENNTSSEEGDTQNKEAQNTSTATPHKDPAGSLEMKSRDRYANYQRSRNAEDSRAFGFRSKLATVEKERNQLNDKTTSKSDSKDTGRENTGMITSVEDLSHEFSKFKNRPSWLMHLPQETATDDTENGQSVVAESTSSSSGSTTVTIQDRSRLIDAEDSETLYESAMTTTDLLMWPNSSESKDLYVQNNFNGTSFTERQDKGGNTSFPQSSSFSVNIDQMNPWDEDQNLEQHKYTSANASESKDYDGVNKRNETGAMVNQTRQIFSDGAPNHLTNDWKMLGNVSKLRDNDTKSIVTERGRLEDEKIMNKQSSDSSDCPSCTTSSKEKYAKLIRLNMFKNILAQKLRLDPNNLQRVGSEMNRRTEDRIPKIPYSIVEQTFKDNAREFDKDEFHAKDQEVIIAGEDMGRDCIKIHATGCYTFNLKGRIRGEVAEAQMWLYKMQDTNDVNGQTFSTYELERLKSGRLVHSSMIVTMDTFTKENWVVMNVTRSVVKWVSKRKGTEMLAIRCITCATRSHRALFGYKHGYKPLLVVKYALNSYMTRHKRSEFCDPRFECCKRELVVNFQEIGMVDIIQPRNLSVGYCYGGCNEIHQYTYNHTAIKQRVRWSESFATHHSMNEQLKPCCVPMVLKDIFIMTSDDDGLIVRKLLPKVVVESCGCM